MMLGSTGHLTAQIAVLDEKIAALCEPYERQIAQLDAIPGIGITAAQDLIAETGIDMSVFPAAGHLCSWARLSPRVRESGGRHKGKNAAGRGNPCIGGTLGETAATVGRTQTFLGHRQLTRPARRRSAPGSRRRKPPSAAAACPAEVHFSAQPPESTGHSLIEATSTLKYVVLGTSRLPSRLSFAVSCIPDVFTTLPRSAASWVASLDLRYSCAFRS